MTFRYATVCSGIEAPSAAWHSLGWEPIFFSEIGKFPCALLYHHYPNVPNYGDMTKFKEWPNATIDVLAGGTPCQSFSIAGLRKGLDDPNGNLTLVYLAIAARYRPKWLVWENVPGVLSDSTGAFGTFLAGLGQLGYGFAYRILDAQYFGVAQRRRRVFVVGYLGDWRRAAAVLFERHSLQGHPAPRREKGENPAPTISARPTGGGGLGTDFDCDGGLIPTVAHALNVGGMGRQDYETETFVTAPTIKRDYGKGYGDGEMTPGGLIYAAFGGESETFIAHTLRARRAGVPLVCGTLTSNGDAHTGFKDEHGLVPVAFAQNQRDEVRQMAIAGALAAQPGMKQQTYLMQPVAFAIQERAGAEGTSGPGGIGVREGVAYTLEARHRPQAAAHGAAVRRLTPRECERLQGFPDDYTLVPYRRGMAADSPRYKALGNSMAVPVMRWIGDRIVAVEEVTL